MLLVFSVSVFVISLITALIMLVIGKNISRNILLIATSLHFILFILTLYNYDSIRANAHQLTSLHSLLLLTICTGIILFGAWMRQQKMAVFKFYFSLWLISLVFFVRSPGRFFAFIYSGNTEQLTEQSIQISGSYYLSRQAESYADSSGVYKVYLKKGLLSYTLRTGLYIPGSIVKVDDVTKDNDSLRFYVVFENDLTLDSIRWAVPLNPKGNTEIKKGKNNDS